MLFQIPSPIEAIHIPLFKEKEVLVYIKRDDLIHAIISGNKWRKLKYSVEFCLSTNKNGIVTFGGTHSNHLLATAFVGNQHQLATIGVIRGERPLVLSPTLVKCESLGMQLLFVSRAEYKNAENIQDMLHGNCTNYHWIPEGGADELGIQGCLNLVTEIPFDFDYITVDCGTSATLAGICRGLQPHQTAIGISVLKGEDTLTQQVNHFNKHHSIKGQFKIFTEYHFGGYAQYSDELVAFMQLFYHQTGIKSDPIYTAKQFYGVLDLIKKDYFPRGSKIIMTHTGGLQGIEGYEKRYGITIF